MADDDKSMLEPLQAETQSEGETRHQWRCTVRSSPGQDFNVEMNEMDNAQEAENKTPGGGSTPAALTHVERVEKKSCCPGVYTNWLNILLVCFPLSVALHFMEPFDGRESALFLTSFLAIIPLAAILGAATEELALRTNEAVGGLLNATFGNAVELILAVVALNKGLIRVVQATLVGSILSNMLLVLGCAIIAGGLKKKSQQFNTTIASTNASLLLITVTGMTLPAILVMSAGEESDVAYNLDHVSHFASIILLVVYLAYLFFQLYTHTHLFEDDSDEEPEIHWIHALLLLIVSTAIITVESEILVGSIEPVAESLKLSQTFIGVIILPIVGNAAEHLSAITVASKNKMDLAISICVGSSIQISLFVAPSLVLVGWAIGRNLTLYFHVFETAIVFVSALLVNSIVADSESNWLEGVMLLAAYGIVAIGFFYHPDAVAY